MGRFTFPRESYIPDKPSAIIRAKRAPVVVYFAECTNGRPYAVAFYGKQSAPAINAQYRNAESRAKHIADYIAACERSVAAKADAAAKRKAFRHTLTVGAILSTSWGYDQTNVEFFQVVALVGSTMVLVREIAQEDGPMSGTCTAVRDKFVGDARRHRVLEGNALDIHGGFGYARPWDGEPERWSSYH